MAQEIIGFKVEANADNAVKSVGSLKQQLREAQKEVIELSAKFGATSEEAVNAAKKAAELKDAIEDAKALTDAFNPDAKFKAFTSTLSAVAGGFGAVQGAIGLVGVESDEVEQALLKVQSAMAISQGLQSIGEGIDSFRQLGAVIQNTTIFQKANNAVTLIATKIQQAFGVATVGVGRSFTFLKAAIAATGIGLLVIGVGALINKISSWTSSTDSAKEANDRLNATIDEQNKLFDKNRQALQNAREDAILEAKIKGESAENIFKINQEYSQKDIELAKKNVADKKKILDDFNAEQRAIEKEIAELGGPLEEKAIRKAREKSKEQLDKLNKDYEDAVRISEQSVRQLNVEGANERLRIADKERADAKEAQSKATQEAKANAEAELQYEQQLEELRRKRFEKNLEYGKSLRDKDFEQRQQAREKEQEAERKYLESRDKTFEEAIDRGLNSLQKLQDTAKQKTDLLGQLLVSQDERELATLDAEYERKLQLIKGNKEAELELEKQYEGLKRNLRMKALNEELGNYASAAGNISQLLGQQTAAGKAFAIAEATINTYKAASQVFAAPVPGVAPVSLGVKIATMISALATGFKNVKSIISTKTTGPSSLQSNIAPTSSAPIAPTPTPQVQSTLLNAQAIQTLGNATSRAYVVESDVSSSQERIRRINRAARLG